MFSVTLLLCFIYSFSVCQNKQEDIVLLKNKDYTESVSDRNNHKKIYSNNIKPFKTKHKNFIAKYNPVLLSAKLSMLFYQEIVSPQLFRHCLYERSCSNFSKKAIEEFGLIKGVFLSADRLMRCNALAQGDIVFFDEQGYAIDEPSFYKIK